MKRSNGYDTLTEFFRHLNNIHLRIQFTKKKEGNGELPILDVLVSIRDNGIIGYQVYRKPTYPDWYLQTTSTTIKHKKPASLKTLAHRAPHICETGYQSEEPKHLEGENLPSQRVFEYKNKTNTTSTQRNHEPPSKKRFTSYASYYT